MKALPSLARTAPALCRSMCTDAFTALEHDMWQAGAATYHDKLGPVTSGACTALLDAVNVTNGSRVLDVACGPGYVAAAAAARGAASVTALDFSPEMLQVVPFPQGLTNGYLSDSSTMSRQSKVVWYTRR